MANTLTFVIDSITADRTTAVLKDNTTYTSPVRTSTALYSKGQKMNADSTVETTLIVTGNNTSPVSASLTEFAVTLTVDGWYRFLISSIPVWTAGTYAIYDAVYNAGIVYRSKVGSNVASTAAALLNTTNWEVITDPATLASNAGEANESVNIDSLIYEVILSPNTEYGYANEISNISEECCSVDCSLENLQKLIRLATIVDGMYVRSDRSEMSAGERLARRAEAILENEF
jgi:hypothetical protein